MKILRSRPGFRINKQGHVIDGENEARSTNFWLKIAKDLEPILIGKDK